MYRLLKNKNRSLALVLASALVPLINTAIFCLGCFIFFQDFLKEGVSPDYPNIGAFLFLGVIGINFLVEFFSTVIISPAAGTILLKREEKALNK